MENKEKVRGPGFVLVIAIILLLVAAGVSIPYFTWRNMGSDLGTGLGKLVGNAVGAFEGIAAGIEDGKDVGLSAEDTSVYLDTMQQTGKLIVLESSLKVENVNNIGDSAITLNVYDATAKYSVDLMEAEVKFKNGGNEVVITVPQPEVELYFDESSREKLAEIQNFSFMVSSKDEIEAYTNSMAELKEKAYQDFAENQELKQIAMDSAVMQIEELVSAVSSLPRTVTVEFAKEGQK